AQGRNFAAARDSHESHHSRESEPMMQRFKLKSALFFAAAASMAAPAFADYVVERTTTYYHEDGTPVSTVSETRYAPGVYVEPAPSTVVYSPPIIVEAPAMTEDQAITSDVMDRLESNPRLTGKIGVETLNRDVKLTGIVTTRGQADLAARDARSVDGV